ncbi:hypothetical protein D3C85_1396830 [compost metagenome]
MHRLSHLVRLFAVYNETFRRKVGLHGYEYFTCLTRDSGRERAVPDLPFLPDGWRLCHRYDRVRYYGDSAECGG